MRLFLCFLVKKSAVSTDKFPVPQFLRKQTKSIASNLLSASILTLVLAVQSSCAPKNEPMSRPYIPAPVTEEAKILTEEQKDEVRLRLQENVPSMVVASICRDVVETRKALAAIDARVIYDPNDGDIAEIPFIVFEINPVHLLDDEKMKLMNLEVFEISEASAEGGMKGFDLPRLASDATYLAKNFPTKETDLDAFREQKIEGSLGENALVAVIDTGIDVAHPYFQNRVVYVSDETDEGRLKVQSYKVEAGVVAANIDGFEKIKVPDAWKDQEEVKLGVISESVIAEQSMADEPMKNLRVDLNLDGDLEDQWLVFFTKDEKKNDVAFVDYSQDGELSDEELSQPISSFNSQAKLKQKDRSFFELKSNVKKYRYPLVFDFGKDPSTFSLFADFGGHGTHVAGIIGGHDEVSEAFSGVAPKTKFMAIKGLGSKGSSIGVSVTRSILKAVFNEQGLVPDVVNLSLGSSNAETVRIAEAVMRDVANRTGVVFVISASNSGPALYTINGMGKFGPFVSVGAYVSRAMIEKNHVGRGTGEPADQVYSFSSSGPTYTGELRPNIVAPGGMVSSTPLVQGGVGMKQGTSMSAPYVSGAIAVVLSALKVDSETKDFWTKRKSTLSGKAKNSLTFMPMTVRVAMENSATRIEGRSPIEQGQGLLKLPAFYAALKNSIVSNKTVDTDLVLNGNEFISTVTKGYSRSGLIEPSQTFSFSLPRNAYLDHSGRLKLLSEPLTVKLARVYSQGVKDHKFQELKDKRSWPFYIFTYGEPNKKVYEETLNWASANQDFIRSARVTSSFVEGTSYLAEYEVWLKGERIQTFVDLVHKPIQLPAAKQKVYDPFSDKHVEAEFAFEGRSRELKPGQIDRLFFYVPNQVGRMSLSLRLHTKGLMQFSLTSPTGREVTGGILYDNEARGRETKASWQSERLVGPGIYELTLASYDTLWSEKLNYSVLVSGDDYQTSQNKIKLVAGESEKATLTVTGKFDTEEYGEITSPKLFAVNTIPNLESVALHETLVPLQVDEKGKLQLEIVGGTWGVKINPIIMKWSSTYDNYVGVARSKVVDGSRIQVTLDPGQYFVSVLNSEVDSDLRSRFDLRVHHLDRKAPANLVQVTEPDGLNPGFRTYMFELMNSKIKEDYSGSFWITNPYEQKVPVEIKAARP